MRKTYAKRAVRDIQKLNNPIKQRIKNDIESLPNNDVATPEIIERHKIAMDEYFRGETIDHKDIDWN